MPYDFDKIIDRGPESGSHSFKWEGYELRFPGFDIDTSTALSMWVADMDFETLEPVKEALRKRVDHGIFGYASEGNNDELREAAISWFTRRYQWPGCEKEWMLFCPGVVPAIYASVQAFTGPGDRVIVQTPVYYPFIGAVESNGRRLANNKLLEDGLRYTMNYDELEDLAKDLDTKLAIFCSPHNPAGRVWSADELERAFRICAENDMLIVCDEIHADLIMPGCTFTTAGRFAEYHDRLILAHSASKTFNLAGLTCALVTVPNDDLRGRLAYRFELNSLSHSNTFGPIAGAAAYNSGDEFVDEVMRYIKGNFDLVERSLAERLPLVKMAPAEGTYLAWLDFRALPISADEVYHRAIENAGVVGDLGVWFGEGGDGFMRFNFACPRARIQEFVDRLCREFADVGAR